MLDTNYEHKKNDNKPKIAFFDRIFMIAKENSNSDYIFMKNIEYDLITKRPSHDIEAIDKPPNLTVYLKDENGERLSY